MLNKCKEELRILYEREKANPGSVERKILLSKYIECANYKEVYVMSSEMQDVDLAGADNTAVND